MQHLNSIQPVQAAPVCGTLISIWEGFHASGVVNTAVSAATGTIVSFLITLLLKYVFRRKD